MLMSQVNGPVSPWGYGSVRAMYPSDLGGPYGNKGLSLPVNSNPAYYGYPGYNGSGVSMKTLKFGKRSCSFGKRKSTKKRKASKKRKVSKRKP
jgi:hypothetical protein